MKLLPRYHMQKVITLLEWYKDSPTAFKLKKKLSVLNVEVLDTWFYNRDVCSIPI